jgi:hypothetical protein
MTATIQAMPAPADLGRAAGAATCGADDGRALRDRGRELEARFADVAQPLLGVLVECAAEQIAHTRRRVGREPAPVGLALEDLGDHVRHGLAV